MTSAGFSNFIGNVPFQMKADEYRGAGFDLTFGDNRRLERLVAGDYQIVAVSLNSVLMNLDTILGKAKVIYAYVKAVGNGSDLIVCRGAVPDVGHLAQLRIGVQRASLEHFIFEYLFFQNHLKPQAAYVWMQRNEYVDAMNDGKIDAAVFCDPALSHILKDDRFRLFGGEMKDIVLTAIGVIAVRADMLANDSDRVAQFVSILLDGMKELDAASDAQLRTTARIFFEGVESPKNTLLSEVAFLDLTENQKLFSKGGNGLFKRCSGWLEFLRSSGLYTGRDLTAADVLDSRIIELL